MNVLKASVCVLLWATVAAAQTTLPAAHPTLGPSGDASSGAPAQAMPPGHPSMDQLLALQNPGAATQPQATGSLTIQATAGTAGAPAIVNEDISVELYHRGSPVKKIDAKLDAKGAVTIKDLPVMPPVQAMVTIKHAGLTQQVLSPELSPDEPNQTIQMKVYETTEEKPAWSVSMQHMIVQWDKNGAQVTEMLSVSSPTDRAWPGVKSGDQRLTMSIPLSPGAQDVELGQGFDDSSTKLVDGNLVTGSALFPGSSEYRISYAVPANKGALALAVTAPADVGTLMVFVPGDGAQVAATGLTGGDLVDMGQGKVRMYQAQKLAAGQSATLAVSGLGDASPSAAAAQSTFSTRNVALGGAFLMVLVGAGMMIVKKPSPKNKTA